MRSAMYAGVGVCVCVCAGVCVCMCVCVCIFDHRAVLRTLKKSRQ
jgi:hypothetical protein